MVGPLAVSGVVRVGPGQDLVDGQCPPGSFPPWVGCCAQELRQARPAPQAAEAEPQRNVNGLPVLPSHTGDRAGVHTRPEARGALMAGGPGADQFLAEGPPLKGPVSRQEPAQRHPARETPPTRPQCPVDGVPGLTSGAGDRAGAAAGPVTVNGMVRIGPGEDLSKVSARLAPRFRTPRRAASKRVSVVPLGRPRAAYLRDLATLNQVSPGAPVTAPVDRVGHWPVAAWCASAQARICFTVNFVACWNGALPRRSVRSRPSELPPGDRASPTSSPGRSRSTFRRAPDRPARSSRVGQEPWAAWKASAQARTCSTVRLTRTIWGGKPRCSASKRARLCPGRKPRRPRLEAAVDARPALAIDTEDLARQARGPGARGQVVRVGPGSGSARVSAVAGPRGARPAGGRATTHPAGRSGPA